MFHNKAQEVAEFQAAAKFESGFREPERVLALVCEVTGETMAQLRKAVMGRSANPARRFAVLALVQHTTLTQKQVGNLLKMSPSQVANVVQRTSVALEPFNLWMGKLNNKV